MDRFGVLVEGRGEVGGHHDDLDAGVRAIDGDFDQVGRFRWVHLPAGRDDQINCVQVQRLGLSDEGGGACSGNAVPEST